MIHIVAFEGLGLGKPSHIMRHLLEPMNLASRNLAVKVHHEWFTSNGPTAFHGHKYVVIGHSMGGASAIAWCKRIAGNSNRPVDVDLLITLDPRPLHRPYIKPDNVKKAVNFYRNSIWMRGYPVEGADNHIVQCGHTYVPALAVDVLREALK